MQHQGKEFMEGDAIKSGRDKRGGLWGKSWGHVRKPL